MTSWLMLDYQDHACVPVSWQYLESFKAMMIASDSAIDLFANLP